jgi:hypothetical protein
MSLPRTNPLLIIRIIRSVSYKRYAKAKAILVSAIQYLRHFLAHPMRDKYVLVWNKFLSYFVNEYYD